MSLTNEWHSHENNQKGTSYFLLYFVFQTEQTGSGHIIAWVAISVTWVNLVGYW